MQDIKTAVTIPAADKFTPDNQTQAQIVEFKHGDPKAAGPVQKEISLNPILSTMRKVEVDPGKIGPDGKPATKTVILHEGAIVQNLDNHGTSKPVSWLTGKALLPGFRYVARTALSIPPESSMPIFVCFRYKSSICFFMKKSISLAVRTFTRPSLRTPLKV